MHDAMALDLAVETALGMLNLEETLVIVTADHGHTMEMAGYQSRGSDIRGEQQRPVFTLGSYGEM
jgi:alkaline phosphatase